MKGETPENFFEFTIAKKRWKMHTFDNSCEHANSGKHYVFPYLHTLTFPENACFQLLTPVKTLLFTQKRPMNERKTRRLPCVNRAVNAGK